MTCVKTRQKTRLMALEAKSLKKPALDFQEPENRDWIDGFYQRNLRDHDNRKIERISAEDRAQWARRVKGISLTNFIEALVKINDEF